MLAVVLIAVMLSGCRRPVPEETEEGGAYDPRTDPLVNPPSLFAEAPLDKTQIATDGTFYLLLEGSPNTLNPLFVSSMYEFTVVDCLYAGLFTFGKDMKWRVNEDMTESFDESEDHTSFVVKLKPGLKWHDGEPVTAHDVVYSWQQILDPEVPCQTQKPSVEPIKECVALDNLTVKFVQPEPLATRLWNLLFPIIPKHIFEKEKEKHPDLKTGEYYTKQSRMPVGNGPYRIVEWRENDKIVVERWEDYKGRKPYAQRIVFRIIPDTNMALLSFEKGQVDVIDRLSAQQFARETNSESFAKVGCKGWGVQWDLGYIGWNMDGSNPFFGDKRVRRAMTHALNTPRILDELYYNLATPCYGMYHPDSWMFNPDVKLLGYDPEKSRGLLDEAGWAVDEDDGWRYKQVDGRKVRFEFTILIAQGSPVAAPIAAILQADLKRLGVEMKTQSVEWSSFLERVRKHEFQAEMAAWGTGTDPDTGWNLWRTDQYEVGRNYGGYSNPRIDELFAEGRREFDFEKRRKIYQEIHRILYDDQPYTWLYNRPILAAFNRRIGGVQFSPRGVYNFDPSFYAWWVAKGRGGQMEKMP
jgi:peptide/nickel transport system substrate-binding protein